MGAKGEEPTKLLNQHKTLIMLLKFVGEFLHLLKTQLSGGSRGVSTVSIETLFEIV